MISNFTKGLASIIVPVFNGEQYINRCIKSLIDQDYKNIEIIIVDDGSTDNTGNICDDYAKNYNIIKVFHKPNGGVSSARNYGIEKAQGEWIFFVDSDDYVEKHYVNCLKIKDNEDYVQGLCRINDTWNEKMEQDSIFNDFAKYWFESTPQFVWCNCYKKEIIENNNIRFDSDVSLGEDVRFNIDYLQYVRSIRRVESVPYHHCDNKNSLVHKLYLDRLEIQKEECKKIEEHSQKTKSMMRVRWYQWNIVLDHYYFHLEKNKKENNAKYIKKCINNAYKDEYFKESAQFIKKNGSVDEKIKARLMGYYRHKMYLVIIKIMQNVVKIKSKVAI